MCGDFALLGVALLLRLVRVIAFAALAGRGRDVDTDVDVDEGSSRHLYAVAITTAATTAAATAAGKLCDAAVEGGEEVRL
jgi:hypothetical protein